MPDATSFPGFPEQLVTFFRDLEQNNNRTWFDAHRDEYEAKVLLPAQDFVYELGKRLRKVVPGVVADPRVNWSIFRIYRDTRFSRDKTPYKTHLAILLWEGAGKKLENPGFYIALDARDLFLGTGLYEFTKAQLDEYRRSVVNAKHGPALDRALKKVGESGKYEIFGEHYKRVPAGYDPNHKRAALLRHNTLYAALRTRMPREAFGPEFVNYCVAHMRGMLPLHRWLVEMAGRC